MLRHKDNVFIKFLVTAGRRYGVLSTETKLAADNCVVVMIVNHEVNAISKSEFRFSQGLPILEQWVGNSQVSDIKSLNILMTLT